MSGPVHNNIKGTTAGTPGTGAFTPNAAAAGGLAWSTVPSGWWGLVRYEDGSAWELSYSFWTTSLSRGTNQFVASSTGSPLSLTSAATAAMVPDANRNQIDLVGGKWRGYLAYPAATTAPFAIGLPAVTVTGTAASKFIANDDINAEQFGTRYSSATTASAQAGWTNTTVIGGYPFGAVGSGRGGFAFRSRFGIGTIPTGPRFSIGLTNTTHVGATEPQSVAGHHCMVIKNSTDTNFQFSLSTTSPSTKIDTGIAPAALGHYEVLLWGHPGNNTMYCLLVSLTAGTIFFKSSGSPVPQQPMYMQMLGGLNATNTGTAIQMEIGSMFGRSGGY